LQPTKVRVSKAAQERTSAIVRSFDVQPVYTCNSCFHAEGFDDAEPFGKLQNYAVQFATVTARRTLPIFNAPPRNKLHNGHYSKKSNR
jgi:hypothetical protein